MLADKQSAKPGQMAERQKRYVSHALVEVRKYKILPFFCQSAVLLDLSLGGFKLEFTAEVQVTPGNRYWLNVPLSPLGIYSPKRLLTQCECRWFDDNRYRIGGVFLGLSKTEQMLIEQIVATLRSRSSL